MINSQFEKYVIVKGLPIDVGGSSFGLIKQNDPPSRLIHNLMFQSLYMGEDSSVYMIRCHEAVADIGTSYHNFFPKSTFSPFIKFIIIYTNCAN